MAEKPKKHRVQLDFSESAFNELNSLAEKLGDISRAEVVRYSLATLKWIYKKRVEESCDIVAMGKDGKIFESIMTFLPEKSSDKN